MTIKIQGNRICENDLHVWILVSDSDKGWIDIPFGIDTPKVETLEELVDYINGKKELITKLIQGKLDRGIKLRQYDVSVDKPELINDDTVLKEIEKEQRIEEKLREIAIKELEKEGKV